MKLSIVKLFYASLCVFIFAMTGSARCETGSGDLIPAGMVIKQDFAPGVGEAVGEISQVSGKVAVIHLNEEQGYWAKEGNKLFKGDTIVTLTNAYAAMKLEDGSFMTLSPETKLEITKSVYAPEKQSRSTFMNLITGKTRFVVKKLVEARHSEFKVKTTTSVAGVRGSDFIITATETITEVTTLENTELEVVSLAAPDAKPTILRDFEMTSVKKGALPAEARKVSAQEVDRMMKEFRFSPKDTAPGAAVDQKPVTAGVGTEEISPAIPSEAMVLREDDLVKPEFEAPREMTGQQPLNTRFETQRLLKQEQQIQNTQTDISQQKTEEIQKSELPDFPGTP